MNQVVQIILGVFLVIFCMVMVYLGWITTKKYKKIYESKEEKIELISTPKNGGKSFISDIEMPSSLLGNEYTIHLILSFENYSGNSPKPMNITRRGDDGNLSIAFVPGKKSINELEFTFKLQGNTLPDYDLENNILKHPEVKSLLNEQETLKEKCEKINELQNSLTTSTPEETSDSTSIPTLTPLPSPAPAPASAPAATIVKDTFYNNLNNKTQNLTQTFKNIYNPELFNDISLESFGETTDESKNESNNVHLSTHSHDHSHDDLNGHTALEIEPQYDTCSIRDLGNDITHHITLAVSNNVVDIYTSGKLVSSCNLRGLPDVSNRPFEFFYDRTFKGTIYKFVYINKSLNQTKVNNLFTHYKNKIGSKKDLNDQIIDKAIA